MSDIPWKVRIEQKQKEAEFFLQELKRLENVETRTINEDLEVYKYYASAFLNAIRCPHQYALKAIGAPADPGKKAWYDNSMELAILKFIRDERNSNIHEITTAPISNIVKTFTEPPTPVTTTFSAQWTNYPGADKGVVSIAQAALGAIKEWVNDGIEKGYIT
jgi:hypothetical protein